MRVAFDARCMQGRPRGMGVYATNLLGAVARTAGRPEIVLLCDADRPDPAGAQWLGYTIARAPGRNEIWWEQVVVPRLARGFDLLHGPANGGPLRGDVPLVLTVHDAIFLRPFREISDHWYARQLAGHLYRTRIYPRVARRAAVVITVSAASRADIVARMGVSPDRIVVTPEALSETFAAAPATPAGELRATYGLEERFFLAMGAYEKRKNIAHLFRALAWLKQRRGAAPQLALAGAENLGATAYEAEVRALGLADRVRFLPYVPAADLKGLQAAAVGFLMPSRQEGFGLPLLEAMSLGTPVVASDIPAHRETVGDAAALADPDDVPGWAILCERLLGDDRLRTDLSVRARARVGELSWDATAAGTLAAYGRALTG